MTLNVNVPGSGGVKIEDLHFANARLSSSGSFVPILLVELPESEGQEIQAYVLDTRWAFGDFPEGSWLATGTVDTVTDDGCGHKGFEITLNGTSCTLQPGDIKN